MSEGRAVQIKHQALQCNHCGQGKFVLRSAKLNTGFMEFLDLGWLNQSADIYVCTHCGFLHWFLEPQVEQEIPAEVPPAEDDREQVVAEEPVTEDDLAEPSECVACHQSIPAGSAICPSCGWSYK
jgi:predicted RNA-binding Zn-ribbon protein involved in translation (DUF1610 family)